MEDIKTLLEGLNSKEWWKRNNIIKKLLQYPEELYIPFLERALKDHENDTLRNASMEFYRIVGSKSLPSLLKLMKDEDEEVRIFAATLLGDIKDPSAVPVLIEGLKDPSVNVRTLSAEALGKIGDKKAVRFLAIAIEDDEPWVAMAAIKALGDIGGEVALKVLHETLKRDEYREMIIKALEESGNISSIEYLLPILKDPHLNEIALKAIVTISLREGIIPDIKKLKDRIELLIKLQQSPQPEIRRAAFIALCWTEDRRGLTYYINALEDEKLQEYAIEAILKIGKEAIPALINALRDTGRFHRFIIAKLISSLGEYKALMEFYNDIDPEVRTEVALALGFIDSQEAYRILNEMIHDPEDEVRMAAEKSIKKLAPKKY
jgi:HEAT repeat protein